MTDDKEFGWFCTCDGCWGCEGHEWKCTCDVDWDEIAEKRMENWDR